MSRILFGEIAPRAVQTLVSPASSSSLQTSGLPPVATNNSSLSRTLLAKSGGKGFGTGKSKPNKSKPKSNAPKSNSPTSKNPVIPCQTSTTQQAIDYFKPKIADIAFPSFPELNKGATIEQGGCTFSYNLNGAKEAKCQKTGLTFTEDKDGNVTTVADKFTYTKKKAGGVSISYDGKEVYSEDSNGTPKVLGENLPSLCPSTSSASAQGVTANNFFTVLLTVLTAATLAAVSAV